jgi:hypothetical protein
MAAPRAEGKTNTSGAVFLLTDRVAAFGLGFDLDPSRDAAVDSETVLPLVIPAECEKFTRPDFGARTI